MKRLYYATFEKGYKEIVKKIIKKIDKNASIKTVYDDSILFFGEDLFCSKQLCFKSLYVVIHNSLKMGVGAVNYEMKALLEKQDLKINLPKNETSFKFLILKENDKVQVSAPLKKALETTLRKITKKSLSYFGGKTSLVLLAKEDGTNLFMRGVYECENQSGFDLGLDELYMISFLSGPSEGEVVLDAFSLTGELAYARTKFFKKSNVIASSGDSETIKKLKKCAKQLQGNTFSILSYDFLSNDFPIKHINKVITNLEMICYDQEKLNQFFDKTEANKIGTLVVVCPKVINLTKNLHESYLVENEVQTKSYKVYKLKLAK